MALVTPSQASTLFPTSWIEDYLIRLALDPETTKPYHDYMTVRWAVRVTPGVRPRTLHQTFNKLVARHEPLRLRFVETKEGWKSEVLSKHPVGLIVEDIGERTADEQQEIVTERVRRPLTALSEVLFEMRLLRFGKSGDVIMMRANHAIVDGYSAALLIEELLKDILYFPLGPAPMSYGQFVAFQQKKTRDRAEKSAPFWEQMLLPPAEELNFGRNAKGLGKVMPNTVQTPIRCETVIGAADTVRVSALSKATGTSEFAVICAAFSDTLCGLADVDSVLINSIFGRSEAALASYVGPSIEMAPFRFTRHADGFLPSIHDVAHIITAIPEHLPTDALDEDGKIMKALDAAGVVFDRFWVNAPLPTGRMKSSPFHRMFDSLMHGTLSLGPISLEQIVVPSLAPTDAEMELTITKGDGGHQATLFADPAGYDIDELEVIADGIRTRLARA